MTFLGNTEGFDGSLLIHLKSIHNSILTLMWPCRHLKHHGFFILSAVTRLGRKQPFSGYRSVTETDAVQSNHRVSTIQ